MQFLTNYPLVLFAVTACVLRISIWIGQRARHTLTPEGRDDLGLILTSTLTLDLVEELVTFKLPTKLISCGA